MPLTFPTLLTTPSDMLIIGVMFSTSATNAAVEESLPPFLRYFSVVGAATILIFGIIVFSFSTISVAAAPPSRILTASNTNSPAPAVTEALSIICTLSLFTMFLAISADWYVPLNFDEINIPTTS